jgi:hypothetical protein
MQAGCLTRVTQGVVSSTVGNIATVTALARKPSASATYVHAVPLPERISGIPDHNAPFVAVIDGKEVSDAMHPKSPATQVHPKVAPSKGANLYHKTCLRQ